MTQHPLSRGFALLATLLASAAAWAHVTLAPGGAAAGSTYDAAFRVGHACKDAKSTTGITVRVPAGFAVETAQARPGWSLTTGAGTVAWRANTPQNAVPDGERAEFIVRGKLTDRTGPLWFKVRQSCDVGTVDWAEVPATAAAKPAFPAVRLEVLGAGVAPVDVTGGWLRTAVRGQSGTGAFMKLNAPSGLRLVGVSTPVAGIAEIHQMKMEGDVMRMREVAGGLELPPRQTVELEPSGLHIMLMGLKQPLAVGETASMRLDFVDAQGRKSVANVRLPVLAGPPDSSTAGAHRH
ncbi:MAG: copper chaperone PCu(A)C [Caldimonas sp.]